MFQNITPYMIPSNLHLCDHKVLKGGLDQQLNIIDNMQEKYQK